LGKDVGGAVKDFKKSMRDEDAANTQLNEPRTLEHEAQNKTNSSVQS
jgi:hypothetical protein